MKILTAIALIISMAGCVPAAPVQHQKIIIITDSKFLVDGIQGNLDSAIKQLGSVENKQIDLGACPGVSFSTVSAVKSSLENTGFDRIGFMPTPLSDTSMCSPER